MSLTFETFPPEIIKFVRMVVDDAAAMLPEADQTSVMKANMAEQILERAAKGERDPIALRTSALLEAAKHANRCHDISPARRAV
jgi:hypothetical protein